MKHAYITLKPSEIYYSQDSIKNTFDQRCPHSNTLIGETLDQLCEGKTNVACITTLRVCWRDDKWFSGDNRRLWVFKHLERLGKCGEIQVQDTGYIPTDKLTTQNSGTSVRVRGNAGGTWYRKPTPSLKSKSIVQPVHQVRTQVHHPANTPGPSYGRTTFPSYSSGSQQVSSSLRVASPSSIGIQPYRPVSNTSTTNVPGRSVSQYNSSYSSGRQEGFSSATRVIAPSRPQSNRSIIDVPTRNVSQSRPTKNFNERTERYPSSPVTVPHTVISMPSQDNDHWEEKELRSKTMCPCVIL